MWPATAGTPDSGYCYFDKLISPQNKINVLVDTMKPGLQQLGHQIQGIAILAD